MWAAVVGVEWYVSMSNIVCVIEIYGEFYKMWNNKGTYFLISDEKLSTII